jgi:hypothetical protein
MTNSRFPQFPGVDAALDALLGGVRGVVGPWLVGLYLNGSLAAGDYTPGRSDIDFIAVTTEDLPADLLPALAQMHAAIAQNHPLLVHSPIEGSYIPLADLRRWDPRRSNHPHLGADGHFAIEVHGSDWVIQRYLLLRFGLPLCGPPLEGMIDPVEPEALRAAAKGILREWWAPRLDDPADLVTDEYQVYTVLTMCRSLYTIRRGAVAAKCDAAAWAIDVLPAPWPELIEQARTWRQGGQFDRLDDSLAFLRFTLAEAGL